MAPYLQVGDAYFQFNSMLIVARARHFHISVHYIEVHYITLHLQAGIDVYFTINSIIILAQAVFIDMDTIHYITLPNISNYSILCITLQIQTYCIYLDKALMHISNSIQC